MSDKNEVKLIISSDGSAAIQEMKRVSQAVTGLESSTQALAGRIKGGWLAIAAAITGAGVAISQAMSYIEEAAMAEQAEESFKQVADAVGVNADAMIANLKRISRATVDTSDMAQQSMKALSAGMSEADIYKTMEMAMIGARRMEQDIKTAWQNITDAIETGRAKSLRDYHLITTEQKKLADAAKEAGVEVDLLTLAFLNSSVMASKFGEVTTNTAEELQRLKAASQNTREEIGFALIATLKYVYVGFQLAANSCLMFAQGIMYVARATATLGTYSPFEKIRKESQATVSSINEIIGNLAGAREQINENIFNLLNPPEAKKPDKDVIADRAKQLADMEAKLKKAAAASKTAGHDSGQALREWSKMSADLTTEIDKLTIASDEYEVKLLDVQNRYKELKTRAEELKAKGAPVDMAIVERWRDVMMDNVVFEKLQEEWKAFTEGEEKYLEIVKEVNKGFMSEQERRVQEIINDEEELKKKLADSRAAESITYAEYTAELERIDRLSTRRRLAVTEEFAAKKREAELNTQSALIELAEREGAISKEDSIRKQITVTEELVGIQQKYLETIDRLKDPTGWNTQMQAVVSTQQKLVDLYESMRDYTGTFTEGMSRGVKAAVDDMQTMFQAGKDMAQDTAKAIQDSFQSFFFDAFQGKLKTMEEYLTSFAASVQKILADILSQQVTKSLMSGVQSLIPAQAPQMQSLEAEREAYLATTTQQVSVTTSLTAVTAAETAEQAALTARLAAQIPVILEAIAAWQALGAAMQAAGAGGGINGGWEGVVDDAVMSGPAFHSGGIAGSEGQPRMFHLVPRFHGGIGPDELHAIIRKGEGVFTPGQMRAIGAAINSPAPANIKVEIKNESGVPIEASMGDMRIDMADVVCELVLKRLRQSPGVRRSFWNPGG